MAGENLGTTNARGRQIRRGQKQAAAALERRMAEAARELEVMHRQALEEIQAALERLADSEGRIPIENLDAAGRVIDDRLRRLNRETSEFLSGQIDEAAVVAVNPWMGQVDVGLDIAGLRQETVRFLEEFRDANGLQLSDRLWRIDRGAREVVREAVQNAIVQGHSASQAARRLVTNGQPVPADLLSKQGLAAIRNIQERAGNALLTGKMNPLFQAERVFRTEINRAFGEASVRAAAQHPDVVAVRFVLSPRHPKFDICDMHASANRHGLGPGVYPIDNHPWPAHPNTFSYLEPVFVDEITDEDRAGRESMTDFINGLTPEQQNGVLDGKAKGWAWRQGLLDPRQIETPWKKIVPKLQRKNIDIPQEFMP